jgi:hypothetical protein
MKSMLAYAAAAAVTLAASTTFTYLASRPVEHDDSAGAAAFSHEDVRRAVEDQLAEHAQSSVRDESPRSRELVKVDQKIAALREQQKLLLERLEALINAPLKTATAQAPYVIPERTRVEELVGAAIVKQREEEDRADRERDAQRQKERVDSMTQRMRDELTKALGLDAPQADQVMNVLGSSFKERADLFAKLRDRAPAGSGPGGMGGDGAPWEAVREESRAITEKANATLKGVLNTEQYAKYEKYIDENPMTRWMDGRGGGRRGGRGDGGGDGQGGATQRQN